MSDAVALMQAVLGDGTGSDEAEAVLEKALRHEVDPLLWCSIHHRVDQAEIMRRAAAWAGLAFYHKVPAPPAGDLAPSRLEKLADVRMCRMRVIDQEIAFAAPDLFGLLRLKAALDADQRFGQRLCLVPSPALRAHLLLAAQDALIDGARQTLTRFWPYAAAQLDLVRPLRNLFAASLVLVASLLLLAPLTGQLWLLPIWVALMLMPTVLRLGALFMPPEAPLRLPREDDADLPVYSILVPLRDEAHMVDQLYRHLGSLDYPGEKLQILFVVESRSPETIAAVEALPADARIGLVVVPDATPRTKPKALDFALPLCRGEFVVVYDAEDRPEAGQLRSIVAHFRHRPKLECIQARLVIDNGKAGLVPALFAGEYAGLFAVLLPALARWGAVMPLGGTSNHFRLSTLRDLGGWDAFNVTEDADLGVRLARRHLRTATSTSVTLEEAPTKLRPWMGQRTRWMKGWMQTFVVHNRRPRRLMEDLGPRGYALFFVTISGMLLAPLLHVGMWPMLVWMQFDEAQGLERLSPWWLACLFVLVVGHGTAIAVNMVGLARTRQRRFWLQQLAVPFYWLLITIATGFALREFVARPFHWFKSPHQVSSAKSRAMPAE